MRVNVDILGVFHDGSIVEIQGALPSISLRIEIAGSRGHCLVVI